MVSRSFFKSSLIYTLIGALPYVSGFILLFWYTTWLTPAQFGINALYLGLMYFVQILSMAGWDLSVGVLYFDYKQNKKQLSEFLGTVFTGILIFGVVIGIVFIVGGFNVFRITFKGGDFLVLLPFGLFTIVSGVFNGIFKSYSGLLINMQRAVPFFWLNFSNFAITIVASLTFLYLFPFTLYGPVLGRLVPAVITASVSLIMVGRQYGLGFHPGYLKKLVSYSSPLLVSALLIWIVTYIDRFIILRLLADPVIVGIYDFAVKLVLGIELIIAGLINTITPKVYSIWKDQQLHGSTIEVNRYYNVLTAIVLLLIPVFLFVVPLVIPVFIKNEIYYEAFVYLPLLAGGYAIRVWFYMFLAPVMFFKQTRVMPIVSAISAAVQLGVGILLIHFFGLWGAVWTGILIKFLQAILLYWGSRKVFTYTFNYWKIVWLPLIFLGTVILSQWFITPENRLWICAGLMLTSVALVYFAYRKEFRLT